MVRTPEGYEKFIKNLPSFSADWVIDVSDVPKAMAGETVKNLLNGKKINIAGWQKKQDKIAGASLKHHGFFTLPRPQDYSSFHEIPPPPLRFKIAKDADESVAPVTSV